MGIFLLRFTVIYCIWEFAVFAVILQLFTVKKSRKIPYDLRLTTVIHTALWVFFY